MISAPPGRPPTLADLIVALQTQQSSLQQLVNLLPGLIHQKAVPLKIYGLAASGSQNKIIVGSYQARRIVNIQLDSSQLYSGGQKLREIWSGFDTDQPFVINMSTVNITIAFDEGADPTNEVITIPAGFTWWNGIMQPTAAGFLSSPGLLGVVRIQDGATAGLLALAQPNADAGGVSIIAALTEAYGYGFNGTTWDRLRTLFNQGAGLGVLQTSPPNGVVLASAVGTGAAVTATAPAPGAGISNWVTGYMIACTAVAAPAAGSFDITTTNLPTNQLTLPVGVRATAGDDFADMFMTLPNPLKVAAATNTTITGTPPANVRLGLAIIGFTA